MLRFWKFFLSKPVYSPVPKLDPLQEIPATSKPLCRFCKGSGGRPYDRQLLCIRCKGVGLEPDPATLEECVVTVRVLWSEADKMHILFVECDDPKAPLALILANAAQMLVDPRAKAEANMRLN